MAEDPRGEGRLVILTYYCSNYSDAGIRTMLRELDAADPLRALLADEDRALETMAAASWEAERATKWADEREWYRERWRTLQRSEHLAVLAALREVAGL